MKRVLVLLVLLVLLPLLVVVAVAHAARARADQFTPVVGSVVGGDVVPVRGSDGLMHVVYELLLMNAGRTPATLERIEIVRAGEQAAPLATLEGDALNAALHELDTRPAVGGTIPPSESRMAFLSLTFAGADAVPDALEHRVVVRGPATPAAREPSELRYAVAPVPLPRRPLPVLAPPLAGGGWVALNGCCTGGGAHRGAVMPVNGQLYDAQRFAIDWMRLDDEGRFVVGDPAKSESWVGYGAPILAAGAGTVVRASDGLENQVPGKLPEPGTITAENVDGNHVVIDHGDGIHSFYAHLEPGSVAVKPGDRVTAGQQIGKLGNTGNTSAPHLHFHVMTGPSPLGSDGIPFELDRFSVTQQIADDDVDRLLAGESVTAIAGQGEAVERALPLDQSVVDFGARGGAQ